MSTPIAIKAAEKLWCDHDKRVDKHNAAIIQIAIEEATERGYERGYEDCRKLWKMEIHKDTP